MSNKLKAAITTLALSIIFGCAVSLSFLAFSSQSFDHQPSKVRAQEVQIAELCDVKTILTTKLMSDFGTPNLEYVVTDGMYKDELVDVTFVKTSKGISQYVKLNDGSSFVCEGDQIVKDLVLDLT